MTDDLLTSDEVRAILRVERTALARYLVGPDRIPHLRLGNPRTGPLRIRRSALEEWIRRREEETGGEIHYGPIPEGLMVLHGCDNKKCVRPDHLSLGTHQQNVAEAMERRRYQYGDRHWTRRRAA